MRVGEDRRFRRRLVALTAAHAEPRMTVGVTAGASTPDVLIKGVIERIMQIGGEVYK